MQRIMKNIEWSIMLRKEHKNVAGASCFGIKQHPPTADSTIQNSTLRIQNSLSESRCPLWYFFVYNPSNLCNLWTLKNAKQTHFQAQQNHANVFNTLN